MGWFRNLLFGKNGSKSKSSQKKKKYRGAVVVADRSGKSGKTVVSNPSATKSEKQSRDRLNRVGSGGTRSSSNSQTVQSKPSKQPVKPQKPKTPDKSNFEKFVEANKNKISSPGSISAIGTAKGTNAQLDAYRARLKQEEEQKKAKQAEEEKKKRKSDYKKAKEASRQQAEAEIRKAYPTASPILNEKVYDKDDVDNAVKELNKNWNKIYKKGLKDAVTEDAKEIQKKFSLEGMIETTKEIEKKAKAYDKKNKRSQLTTDEMLRRQFVEANPTYRTPKGGDKVITKELQEKLYANMQSGLDKGSVAEGFLRGSMPVADLNKIINRKYGIELDDTRAKQKIGYNVGEMGGYIFKSAALAGMGQDAIAKGLTKAVLKKTGKKELGKAAKFGVDRAADVVASIPINAEDAAKNSSNLKEFGKNMAVNSALDAGFGTALDGGVALARKIKAKQGAKAVKILDKVKKNEPITESEIKTLNAIGLDKNGLPIQNKDSLDTKTDKEKSLRYQASSQAMPDNSYLFAGRLSNNKIPGNSQKINTESTEIGNVDNKANKKDAPGTVQMSNDPHLTSKTVSQDASNNNIPGSTQQINTEPPKKYTGVRIRSNITKKEYNIPHKKELDIKKNNDGSIEVAGQPLQEVDRKDLRGFVKKYAEKNYLSRFDDKGNLIEAKPIIIESDKKQVIITKKGINDVAEKIKGGKKSVDYSESLLALDDIIEKAIKVDESPNLKGRENPYSYYESIFRTNNQPYRVYLRIKDTPNVSRYHYHTLEEMGEIEIQKIEPLDGTYTPKGDEDLLQAGSIINNSIPDSPQKIKGETSVDKNLGQGYNEGIGANAGLNNKEGVIDGQGQKDLRGAEGGVQRRQERINNDRAGNPDPDGKERLGRTQMGSGHDGVELLDKKIRDTMNKYGIADLKLRETSNDNAIFVESLEAGRHSNRHGSYVDGHDAKELTQAGTRTFLSEDNLAGIAVEKDGNITAAFKNSNSTVKGAVNDLIITARNHGGTKMDCYGKHLVNMYESNGYVPVARIPFNPEYVDDTVLLKTKPDVYVLMKNTDDLDSVIRKNVNGDYRKSTLEELNQLPTFDDYDEALKYRDDLLAKQEAKSGGGPKATDRAKTAKDFKDESPENMYKKATEGVSDAEVGQHYEKLKKQILENLGEDSDFIKELNLVENNGRFDKKKIMPQDKAREQAKKEVEADFDTVYKNVLDASDGDDEHLFYARATEVVNKLRKDIEAGVNESESAKKLIEAVQKCNDFASTAGRALNSTKMILTATPEGRLRVADRELKRLNERFSERLKGENIELSEEQIGRIVKAETDEQIEKTMKEINVEIWDQIPATTFEKINEFRHFSMLANIKTHERNIIGNTFFKGARNISDGIEVALNKAAKGKIERMGGTVDMVASSRRVIRENNEYLENVFKREYEASGSKTKYIESVRPEGSKTIKFAPVNAAIQGNYKLLELEDMLAFKPEFKKSYVRWCKAHNIDTSDLSKLTKRQHEAASAFAMKKAEEATFRDASAFSEWLTRTKSTLAGKKGNSAPGTAAYRAGNMLLESQLPFVKTPINVFRRSVDYSPVGLVRGVAELMAAKDVEVFKQGLHHLSTGLTGTGVFALGVFLNSKDLITLEAGNESGSEYYDRDMGFQDYSIKLGNGKYSATIDWASPMNVSLFMGAQAGDMMSQDGLGLTDMLKGLSNAVTKPMLDMSFMSSAKDTVEMFMEQAYDYETGKMNYMDAALQALGGSVPQGYMNGFIPQFVSHAAQAHDIKQRDTRSTKKDPLEKSWDSWRRKMINRIPVLREYYLNPKIDRFGDDKVTGGNIMTRVFNSFINPSNVKEIKFTNTDRELINIYKHLPEETSSEKKSKQYFFYNFTGNPSYDLGNDERMNYKELYGYGKEKRKQQTTLIEAMTGSSSYKNMTWGMKADEVNKSHWVSQAVADKETYGAEFAANKIAETGSETDKRALKLFRENGGKNENFMDFYITKEKLLARSHDTDYHTKALAVALSGNETMGKIYDINVDKIKTAQEYLKKGGSENEYATAMCNVISKIDKAEVSVSKANKAVSAAYFKINKRTYKAMGLSKEKANMGIGLKKYEYKFDTLEKMKSDSKYRFDKDESGSLNKEEMTSYINSLGIKDNVEKACLFEYLFPYDSRNPFGSIPNYLDMKDDDRSGGGYGSRGYRRYGRGHGRGYGGGRGRSGSSAEEMTEFEKYSADLLKKMQSRKIEKATMQYKKLNTHKYTSDQYRKAITRLLAKKLMEK